MRSSVVATLLALAASSSTSSAQILFISEYVEGTSFNKALEIYNPGSCAVDLSGYRIDRYSNGSTTPVAIPLAGVVLGGDVHVIAHSSINIAMLPPHAVPDQLSGSVNFNGNDALTLVGPGGIMDAIGEIGVDPGTAWAGGGITTQNETLKRHTMNCAAPPIGLGLFDPSWWWTGCPVDDFSDLGVPPNPLTSTGCTDPLNYCTAGKSASGCQAQISASGSPSATAATGFDLVATTVEGAKDGLFFFGSNGRQANPWGNGTSYQCVVPPVKRAGLLTGTGTPGLCDGSFSQDLNALWCPGCPKPQKNPGAGTVIQAQLWYRDPQNTSNQTTSLSDALELCVGP